jgi:hypothetical protein
MCWILPENWKRNHRQRAGSLDIRFKSKQWRILSNVERNIRSSRVAVRKTALVHDPVHQEFEQLGNSRQYRNATVIRWAIAPTTLINGSKKREFPSIGEDTRCQWPVEEYANAEAQFFRISGGTPSGPEPLLLSNSNNAFSTSETVHGSEPKVGPSFTSSGPGLDGTYKFAWSYTLPAIPMPPDPQNSWPMDNPLASKKLLGSILKASWLPAT